MNKRITGRLSDDKVAIYNGDIKIFGLYVKSKTFVDINKALKWLNKKEVNKLKN